MDVTASPTSLKTDARASFRVAAMLIGTIFFTATVMVDCAIECFQACPSDSWLQQHEALVVSLSATVTAAFLGLLQCLLRSRCTEIRMGCCHCLRDVVDGDAATSLA